MLEKLLNTYWQLTQKLLSVNEIQITADILRNALWAFDKDWLINFRRITYFRDEHSIKIYLVINIHRITYSRDKHSIKIDPVINFHWITYSRG